MRITNSQSTNSYAAQPPQDPLNQALKQALSAGKITQTQYASATKQLGSFQKQMMAHATSGTAPSASDVQQMQTQVGSIFQSVGLTAPTPPSGGAPPGAPSGASNSTARTSGASATSAQMLAEIEKALAGGATS